MTAAEAALLDWMQALGGPAAAPLGAALLAESAAPNGAAGGIAAGGAARSRLNNDGSALQACVTYAPGRRDVRLIGDPAAHERDPARRFAAAGRALAEVVARTGTAPLAPVLDATLHAMLPADKRRAELEPGLFWIAAGLAGGVALYVNTRWGDADVRWSDTVRWLAHTLPATADAHAAPALVARLAGAGAVASVGVEGRTPAGARAKVYWRFRHAVPLATLGVPILRHPDFADVLARLVGEASLPLGGVVCSAGFALATGALADAKVDLCAHCLVRTPAAWADTLARCCDDLALGSFDLGDGLRAGRGEVAFVGFARTTDGERRLNVYLKPARPASA